MYFHNLILKRESVRTFSKRNLSDDTIENIKKIITNNTGPFHVEIKFDFINLHTISNDNNFKINKIINRCNYCLIGIINNIQDKNLIDFGYCFEKIILELTHLELGSCIISGMFNRLEFENMMNIQSNEMIPAISPIGYARKFKSLKEIILKLVIKSKKRKALEELFFENDLQTPLIKNKIKRYIIPLESVRLAPSSRNRQPWRIIKAGKFFHFYIVKRENSITQKKKFDFDLMSAGIAMAHFELTANDLKLNGKWDIIDPKLENNLNYIASWVS